MHANQLASAYPRIAVDPGVVYVEDRGVVTSAGTAAGIDAALHIVSKQLGTSVANVFARRIVVPPQRDGGQAQYTQAPLSEDCIEVAEWMLQDFGEYLPIEQLARKAPVSPRTFARRFRADMGTTPAAWLNRQRIIRAQQLLEQTESSLETVASDTGFGVAAVMRHHFVKCCRPPRRRTGGRSARRCRHIVA